MVITPRQRCQTDTRSLTRCLIRSAPIGEAQGRCVEGLRQSQGLFNLHPSPSETHRPMTKGWRGPPCTHVQVKDKGQVASKHGYKDVISLLLLNSLKVLFFQCAQKLEHRFGFLTSKHQQACRCLLLFFSITLAGSSLAPRW